jgi:hypothetical protein
MMGLSVGKRSNTTLELGRGKWRKKKEERNEKIEDEGKKVALFLFLQKWLWEHTSLECRY